MVGDGRGSIRGMDERGMIVVEDENASPLETSHDGIRWHESLNLGLVISIGFLVKIFRDLYVEG